MISAGFLIAALVVAAFGGQSWAWEVLLGLGIGSMLAEAFG